MVDTTAERAVRNEAIFREANEAIESSAVENRIDVVPFICECADPACTRIVRLPLEDYERVRANGRYFLVAPGHEDDTGPGQVVEENAGYEIVEKVGEVGRFAQALDERR